MIGLFVDFSVGEGAGMSAAEPVGVVCIGRVASGVLAGGVGLV
jgi:hypothetical protein